MAATILWQSSYNGGLEQYYKVQFWKSGEAERTTHGQNISEPEMELVQQYTVGELSPDTCYWFTVLAINEIGVTSSKTVNCTTNADHTFTSSQGPSELFAAAISILILAVIIVVVFTISCRRYWKEKTVNGLQTMLHDRSGNYVDLTTNHGNDEAYATLQETAVGTQNKNEDHFGIEKQTYEECQPKTIDGNTYKNNQQIRPPKKDVVYANMTME